MRLLPALTALACLVPLAAWAGPVDINSADAPTLARELKGIGPARAQAIVAYRNQNGPFKTADDLVLVKSISQKVVDNNRENIRIEGARSSQGPAKAAAKPVTAPRPTP